MSMLSSISFSGYKSFSADTAVCLNNMKRVNVIIGKNNAGKSSVLDVISVCLGIKNSDALSSKIGELRAGFNLDESHVTRVFSRLSYTGNIQTLPDKAKKFVGLEYWVDIELKGQPKYKMSAQNNSEFLTSQLKDHWTEIASVLQRTIINDNWTFRKLSADRNIVPELENNNVGLETDGSGASNLIRKFLNYYSYEEDVIQETLLGALNKIMQPESEFEEIKVQQIEQGDSLVWEVFLREKGNNRFALSQSGSGLKTIILILLNLLVVPKVQEYADKQIHYGFEEVENNLHPALQRRVFDYIYDFAVKNDIFIFLTTHSHVAINSFFGKKEAQIYHVIKENDVATIYKIETHLEKINILDDLNVKASDMLQSNGIIWVEGPSDRIYIKRWLEVFCNCIYEEGKHYQFMYYGGKLLSHYSTDETDDLINILTTNRNSAIVLDSDKRAQQTAISSTKKRILTEFEKTNMFAWKTQGKEIENYVPMYAINEALGCKLEKQCGKYELFPEYIEENFSNFSGRKVPFANKVKDFITSDNANILDLSTQIVKLYAQIERWNK